MTAFLSEAPFSCRFSSSACHLPSRSSVVCDRQVLSQSVALSKVGEQKGNVSHGSRAHGASTAARSEETDSLSYDAEL